ncbi:MAG TPA: type VI secretion system tip protein TssI/VgrG, partial [Gemmataceae bacterium]
MPEYSQADRALQVKSPLGEGRLLLAALRGREAVSELFEFDLHLLAPNDLPPVTFGELMGRPMTATVRLPAGNERKIHGLVMALRQEGRDREFTHFRATLRPAWWTSTLRVNSRIFQQKTAPEILRELLGGVPAEWRLAGEYPRRDFCCQYQETDFAFASRLMEEEGIFYYFEHAEDAHTLVLADGVAGCPRVPGPGRVRFDDSEAARRDHREPLVWRWEKVQEVCATKVTVWDSHFELFRENLAAEAGVPDQVRAGRAEHAPAPAALGPVPVYLHDGDYAKRYDGFSPAGDPQPFALQGVYADAERTAGIRAEQAAARSVRVEGESDACYLTPGHAFELSGHFDGDGGYLVTRVEHEVELKGAFWAQGGAGETDYRNRFEASPLGLVPRPARRTPRPKVGGPLTAVVVGPPGEEIFVDAYGRVKVQFFWD